MTVIPGIRFNDPEDAKRLSESTHVIFNPLADQVIARVDDRGVLVGGVLYKDYTGRGGSIAMHVAGYSPAWINRTILWIAFDYPFNQLGVNKLFGQVPSWNRHAYKFDKHLGFVDECEIPGVYPGGNMMLLSMTREQCRFLDRPPRSLKD
jgi:RimJ/RimL family protein N-acetyltransferase